VSEAVRATLHMKVKAGREDEFEQAWLTVAEKTRRVPGNLRQTLLSDPDTPSSFVITSDWVNREAFGAFERSPEQDELTATIRELRESASMTVRPLLHHVEGETDV
jgi:heme-degrading monooxygenase HmoA